MAGAVGLLILGGGLGLVDGITTQIPSGEGISIVRVPSADGHHQANVKPKVWRNWRSDIYPRGLRWQQCGANDLEFNTAYIAFNNWAANFGHNTYHTYTGYNCTPANDENLVVRSVFPSQIDAYCPAGAVACFYGKSCYRADYPYTPGCNFTFLLMNVLQAYIVYDWVWLTSDASMNPGGMPSPIRYAHMFGHEFGHAMRLEDHHGCSPASIMTGAGCTHMVNSGPPPNDVCVPDEYMGYGTARC